MPDFRTTAKDFAAFKAEVQRLVRLWRIVGQRIEFLHEKIDARAEIRSDAKNAVCVIVLSTEWGTDIKPTDTLVKDCARHECVHLLIDRLDEIAQIRFVTRDQHIHAVETVVRHLAELLPS